MVQVMTNFGSSKADLNLKYRLGLEHALAQANFLENPDITLVQALAIFLMLVRRHDSPRYAWMMTGLVIRMAQYLGLQRDGSHFDHLTPFEVELRRKVWWLMCVLDSRASEDQGTEPSISNGSYDTKIPLNINTADLDPETKEMPMEHEGVTDMTFPRLYFGMEDSMRQMLAKGVLDGATSLEDKTRLLNEAYQKYDQLYLNHPKESDSIIYWVTITIIHLVMAKMTLIVFLPVLFSSPSDHFSEELHAKLLISAIEVAEYNHELNSGQDCRQWRWIYQTYTHWHAVVYLLMDVSRREWSPTVERAWLALQSSWLIPVKVHTEKNVHIWVPLRKLMAKARKHREAELMRLRANPQAATNLQVEDEKMPLPSSSGSFSGGNPAELIREQWRQLVGLTKAPGDTTQSTIGIPGTVSAIPHPHDLPDLGNMTSHLAFEPMYLTSREQPAGQLFGNTITGDRGPERPLNSEPYEPMFSTDAIRGSGLIPWLWHNADPPIDVVSGLGGDSIDVSMGIENNMNWYNWVESAKGLE
jgi:hypothetical protein